MPEIAASVPRRRAAAREELVRRGLYRQMKAGDGAGRHDDANQPLIKQLKQKRPSSKDTSRITISLTYTDSSCNEIQSLAGRMVVLSFGAEVEGTVQFTHLILILTYSCRILESSTVCSVC